jgi:hypothetical protein
LGYSLSFFKGLLENPVIWVEDMIFSDRNPEDTPEVA